MRFTKYYSLKQILEYPRMAEYLKVFYSDLLLSLFPLEMADYPIARLEQEAKTPWGEPFSVVTDQLMDSVNLILDLQENHTRRAISLWDPRSWGIHPKEGSAGKAMDGLTDRVPEKTAHKLPEKMPDTGSDWNLDREARGGKNQVFLIAPAVPEQRDCLRPGQAANGQTANEQAANGQAANRQAANEQAANERAANGQAASEQTASGQPVSSQRHSGKTRKAVIICPGGGYEQVCFSGEGNPVMEFMEARGYCSFILRYRTGGEGFFPNPQVDLALAIQYVRLHADEYGIDPQDILLIGSSAGGHLCASYSALYEKAAKKAAEEMEQLSLSLGEALRCTDARPDKLCLCYPVISFLHEPHEGSARIHTGGRTELREKLSVENLVDKQFPPTFLWTCADDDCVPPSNTKRMAQALKEAGVPFRVEEYPSGGHGCALAFSKEARDWSRAMEEFFTQPLG